MQLDNRRIAILAADGFEQSELLEPKGAFEEAGAVVDVISFEPGEISGWSAGEWGKTIGVDLTLGEAMEEDYDALILPGGVMSPDKLRMEPSAVSLVQGFVDSGKPIAAICHGPWTLLETGALQGRTVTSWPSLKTDLLNAGANWEDSEVVVDGNFVTSRKPEDLPAFIQEVMALISGIEPLNTSPRQKAAEVAFDRMSTLS